MTVLKCKMCGGDLNFEAGVTVVECEYCGIKQTVTDADRKALLFAAEEERKAAQEEQLPDTSTRVGDIVQYGSYQQKPIKWLVLDKQDGKLLLLSRDLLDQRPYDRRYKNVTWEGCQMRKWLNEEFYNTAFSQDGAGHIVMTRVKNEDNKEWGTRGGNDTEDRIFLLSTEEVKHYLPSDAACRARLVNGDQTWWWWLRSPGGEEIFAVRICDDGVLYNTYGVYVYMKRGGVRPALWFQL